MYSEGGYTAADDAVFFTKTESGAIFRSILESGISLRVRVTGRSMVPKLSGGDVVTIINVPSSSLRRGDLIFFDGPDGAPVLHRIVRMKRSPAGGHIFQTRGDALLALDGPVHSDAVMGRVSRIESGCLESGIREVEMDSTLQRTGNYLRAVFSLAESGCYFLLSGLYRRSIKRAAGFSASSK